MTWLEIVILSVLFGLAGWFESRIELPDIPDKLKPIIFAGLIVLATIALSFKAFKQNKK